MYLQSRYTLSARELFCTANSDDSVIISNKDAKILSRYAFKVEFIIFRVTTVIILYKSVPTY